ncbi:hypothetical protein [Delftia acidovorans]|uniref:hypothetical protein n=1 Tax=Delftia acidovorans TaxID=80866 RepID=UPI00241BFAD0|nr:hypothetical protein [Delftia acidovorans]
MTVPSTLKPSALVAAAHIIASDGPGEVVRKLDAAFNAAVAPHSDLDADLALTIDQRDTAEGWADGLAALIGKYFGRDIGEHSSAHCPWQEAKEIIAEAEPYRRALDAPAGPATPAQIQALRRARSVLCAIGKTYDDSELRTRALEADEEIDRMLAATPQVPVAPSVVTRRMLRSLAERDVIDERRRQVSAEGCSTKHDDVYQGSELALAAAWYATPPFTRFALDANDMSLWPVSWLPTSFKPGDRRRELVKSGALIIAELERLDREAAQAKEGGAA